MQIPVDTSNQIRVCRVLCIFFLMYVHVYPGLGPFEADLTEPLISIKLFVIDLLGRASVPALTLISGYLMVNGLERHTVLQITRNRLVTIVLPMITWNLVAILLCYLIYKGIGHQLDLYKDMQGRSLPSVIAFKVLALDSRGATEALNFLRDLFVCGLFIKPLVWGAKRGGWLFIALIWVFGICFGFEPVAYRDSIPMFFALGVFIAVRYGHIRYNALLIALTIVSLAAVVTIDYLGGVDQERFGRVAEVLYGIFKRLAVASLFLIAAHFIAISPWSKPFFKMERNIFFAFLAHSMFFLVAWGIWRQIMGTDLNSAYVVFFIANPIVFLAIVTFAGPLLDLLPSWLQLPLRGRTANKQRRYVAATEPALVRR